MSVKFNKIYEQSIKNPENFWKEASNDIFWFKKPKKILNNLTLSGTTNLDVLNPSFEKLINQWFKSLEYIDTPDVNTISLINETIAEFTKRFLENIKEKSIK